MMDLGRVNQATAARRAAGHAMPGVPRHQRRSSTDSHGRAYGSDDFGRAYSPCPMCSQRSMIEVNRQVIGRVLSEHVETVYKCLSCGYSDSTEHGALV